MVTLSEWALFYLRASSSLKISHAGESFFKMMKFLLERNEWTRGGSGTQPSAFWKVFFSSDGAKLIVANTPLSVQEANKLT